jgi:hypothetical protein
VSFPTDSKPQWRIENIHGKFILAESRDFQVKMIGFWSFFEVGELESLRKLVPLKRSEWLV